MEFRKEPERIIALDETGELPAEVTFPPREELIVINHTFVDASLRGWRVVGRLLCAVVDVLCKEGNKAHPICSYAVR